MISQLAAELRPRLERLDRLYQAREYRQALQDRRDRFVDLAERLSGPVAFLQVAGSSGMAVAHEPAIDPAPWLHRLRDVQHALLEDPQRALESNVFRDAESSLTRAVDDATSRAERTWRGYCDAVMPTPQPSLLAALEDHDPATVAWIRTLDDRLRPLAEGKWVTAEQLTTFDDLLSRRRQLWTSLDAERIPAGVLEFLRQAGQPRGAPLALLTEQVLDWLRERGVLDHYAVVPSRARR